MEVGESVCVATPDDPPDVEFEAKIVSVTFNGNAKVAWNNAAVTSPHWEDGKEAQLEDEWDWADKLALPKHGYSKKAAAYFGGGDYTVDVKINVTKSVNISGAATLIGRFGGMEIKGTCPTNVGEHLVKAKFEKPPDGIQGYRGEVGWGLDIPSAELAYGLGSTLAEVYFLLANPTPAHQKPGVWVEALRFLCGRVGVVDAKDPERVGTAVAGYCHGPHGLKYDTGGGRSWYGSGQLGTGGFALKNYILKTVDECNCYDQAGAVHSLCGAVGVVIGWLFLQPFGYIRDTNLVGIGICNNPFYTINGGLPKVERDDPNRTSFYNHSFCTAPSGRILDACAGPHRATESREQYLAASIDYGDESTWKDITSFLSGVFSSDPRPPTLYETLYSKNPNGSWAPGTASELILGSGVTGVRW